MSTKTGIWFNTPVVFTGVIYGDTGVVRTPSKSSTTFTYGETTFSENNYYVPATAEQLSQSYYYFLTENQNLKADVYEVEQSTKSLTKLKNVVYNYDDDYIGYYVSPSSGDVYGLLFVFTDSTSNTATLGTLTNCSCNYSNGDSVDTSKNLVITANDGYEFADSSYQYKVGSTSKNFAISSDKTTLTIDMSSVSESITVGNISATAKSTETYIVNIGTLENCTCNYGNGNTVDTSKNLVITANDGYEFADSSYQYKVGSTSKNFAISSDKTTLTIDMSSVSESITVGNISATAKSTETYIVNIGTLENCTCNYGNGDTVDTSKNLVITANDGYEFKSTETFLYYVGDYSITFNRTSNNILYAVLTNINANVTVNDITATLIEDTSKTISITGSFVNCTCNYSNGEKIDVNKPILITPLTGYEFTGVYTLLIDGATETFDYNTSGQLQADILTNTSVIELNQTYRATKETNTTNFARIYKMTKALINQLASKRFLDDNGNTIDKGQYIVSLTKLKLPLDASLIGDDSTIVLGNYDSGVLAPAILYDDFTLNLGKIKVERKYNNAYDFLNTNCYLIAPLFEPIQLDNFFCIGRTLTLSLYVNFYSKNATLIVKNDLNENHEFYSKQQVFDDIPFMSLASQSIINKIEDNYYNLIDTAKLVIYRNTPYQSSNYFGRDVIKQSTLAGLTGFTKVKNIEISSQMLNDEKQELDSILNSGIIL